MTQERLGIQQNKILAQHLYSEVMRKVITQLLQEKEEKKKFGLKNCSL